MVGDSSEQITGRYLIEAILGFTFVIILIYFISGSYVIDKTMVAYKLLDLTFTLSTLSSIPAQFFVKMPFKYDDELYYDVNHKIPSIIMFIKKFESINLHEQRASFIENKNNVVIKSKDANKLIISKVDKITLGKLLKLRNFSCPKMKITKTIKIIPSSDSSNNIKLVNKVLSENIPLKNVIRASLDSLGERDIYNGVLNIIISEGSKKIKYPFNEIYAGYACSLGVYLNVIPLPYINIKNYIEISLREEDIPQLIKVLRKI
jgi:hypothetical protein